MSTERIVVVGEALVDVFDGTSQAGGAPLNVAVGAARLARRVAWTGPVGRDQNGRLVRDTLEAAGVDTDLIRVVDGPTSRALVSVDASGQPSYEFEIEGTSCGAAGPTETGFEDANLVSVTAGAIAFDRPGLGMSMARVLREVDAPVWLDPNVRPGAAVDAGAYPELVEELVGHAALVKVSTEDLHLLRPGQNVAETAARWAALGPALVVVTDGAKGLMALRRGGAAVERPSVPTALVDTVGAGDATMAALIAWADQRGVRSATELEALTDDQVGEALQWSARAAAITCSRRGAQPPTVEEMRRSIPPE